MSTDFTSALGRAQAHAPFLRGLIRREGALVAQMEADEFDAAVQASLARLDPADPGPSLRHARGGIALVTALADLAGAWPLEKVTQTLSDFADLALQFAIDSAFARRGLEAGGLAALALGKMGSHELNYSSDIDLIFIHDPDTLSRKEGEDPNDAAVRLVRQINTLLSARTAHGYVFRVDLRLRPDPDSTPSSLPVGAAEQYYQSQALPWERAAFIRARVAAGDKALGKKFLKNIANFIWRRSLDYTALAEIRDISHQIREHYAEAQKLGPGFDLKRGRGGIREIEFFAQVHQLIFGGRDESLRSGATLDALAALEKAGQVKPDEAATLSQAYRLFRTIEHRIQMVADQQTHSIPKTIAERNNLAELCGLENWKALEAELQPHLRKTGRLYDELLEIGEEKRASKVPATSEAVEKWARTAKIKDPELAATLVEAWRSRSYRSLKTPHSLASFETILPTLLGSVGTGRHGREGLIRLDQMIKALPSGVLFWRLLAAHPSLAVVIARLLTSTPELADALAKRPALIDVLITPSPPLPDIGAAQHELAQLTRGLDKEPLLDRIRQWTSEQQFQLGVELLDHRIHPIDAARTLSLMAEATVSLLTDMLIGEMEEQHGPVPGCEFVVLALGRFGGGELTVQSDLDLITLFTGDFETQSTGPKPISASLWFNRLAQRLVGALSVPTAAGTLYEVDMRLRPSGGSGLLAVSLDSFTSYQLHEAEIWETMALTRARPIAGSKAARQAVRTRIDNIIRQPRDPEAIRAEAIAIRKHMAKHKPAIGQFDMKLMKGGLVDIEFIAQTRALIAARPTPTNLDAQLQKLAPGLQEPARLMMSALVMLRLMQPQHSNDTPKGASAETIARACGFAKPAELKQALQSARKTVGTYWQDTFEGGPK